MPRVNTISMAIGPVRGKSWGGLHGWLPVAQTGLSSAARTTGLLLTGRHQGGRKEPFEQPGKHQGGRKGSSGQPGRHQGGRKEAPGRQEGAS